MPRFLLEHQSLGMPPTCKPDPQKVLSSLGCKCYQLGTLSTSIFREPKNSAVRLVENLYPKYFHKNLKRNVAIQFCSQEIPLVQEEAPNQKRRNSLMEFRGSRRSQHKLLALEFGHQLSLPCTKENFGLDFVSTGFLAYSFCSQYNHEENSEPGKQLK